MHTLDELAIMHGTDKNSQIHNYTKVYTKFFEPLRQNHLFLLELGTGAYWKENQGFHGSKTWVDYFENAKVASIDIHPKITPTGKYSKIKFYQGSQDDPVFLNRVCDTEGAPDIIIDDASHISPLTIESFRILFPRLAPGGIYVIEDTHTSYWDKLAADGTDFKGGLKNPWAILNFLKDLTDSLNHEHNGLQDVGIESIHFYEKIVFIIKK